MRKCSSSATAELLGDLARLHAVVEREVAVFHATGRRLGELPITPDKLL